MSQITSQAQRLGAAGVRALYVELVLEPKPGLVSLRDTGSHRDMNATTFARSLFALRHYFPRIAQAGMTGAPFQVLEQLGMRAETRMLAATGGVNTHRGAVFCLGLLCAAAGRSLALAGSVGASGLRRTLLDSWGAPLRKRALRSRSAAPCSHGQRAARLHGLRGAGDEAAEGFPTLFNVTLPALHEALRAGLPERSARVEALFATIAVLGDTNLVHRGGIEGLRHAQQAARGFLAAGGTKRPDWLQHARSIHAGFVARNLSPGGSADLLGSACWIASVCPDEATAPLPSSTHEGGASFPIGNATVAAAG
jgi:triphosphoribosyl-dephospho-CoA synthase